MAPTSSGSRRSRSAGSVKKSKSVFINGTLGGAAAPRNRDSSFRWNDGPQDEDLARRPQRRGACHAGLVPSRAPSSSRTRTRRLAKSTETRSNNCSASMPSSSAGRSLRPSWRNGWTSWKATGRLLMSTPPIRIRRAIGIFGVDQAAGDAHHPDRRHQPEPPAPLERGPERAIADADLRAGVDDDPDPLPVERGVDQHQPAEQAAAGDHDRAFRPALLAAARRRDRHLPAAEIEEHALRLQAIDAEHARRAEIGARQGRRVDAVDRARADPEAGMTTVSIRLTSLIEWTVAVRPGRELERARQLARDDGALGAGVDDEVERTLPVDTDRHGHPVVSASVRPSVSACCRSARVGAARRRAAGASWPRTGRPRAKAAPSPRSGQRVRSASFLSAYLVRKRIDPRPAKKANAVRRTASAPRRRPSRDRAAAPPRRRGCRAWRRGRRRPRPTRC